MTFLCGTKLCLTFRREIQDFQIQYSLFSFQIASLEQAAVGRKIGCSWWERVKLPWRRYLSKNQWCSVSTSNGRPKRGGEIREKPISAAERISSNGTVVTMKRCVDVAGGKKKAWKKHEKSKRHRKSLMTLSKSSGLGIFTSGAEEWQKFLSHFLPKKENDSRIV